MIDTEMIKAIIIVALIALIATLLRRKVRFIIVLWAIALGLFIAAKIMKMEAVRQLRETMMQTTMMTDELNREIQMEILREPVGSSLESLVEE